MTADKICPTCGKPLPENTLMGLCPDCLLQAGFGTLDTENAPRGKNSPFVPPAPEDLARYFPELEIMELLGQGGMGAVYKARQKRLDRLVALKILPPNVGADPSFAARFEREAKALAQLHHPHIVTLYDSGQTDGMFYFFMEYVDGMNLRQLLGSGHVSPKEALAIVPQICDALQFAHDRGIIHRDIKPENILLNQAGQVKIADFGVAKIVGRELSGIDPGNTSGSADHGGTEAGKVIGTPQYMAPEQLSNPLDVDNRADIYALGVVFYQMLTGELPAGKFAPPSRKVQMDARLDEVVLRALEKKPENRYQQASVFKTQVEAIAEAPEVVAKNKTLPVPLRPKSTAFKVIAIVSGLICFFLIVVILSTFFWVRFTAVKSRAMAQLKSKEAQELQARVQAEQSERSAPPLYEHQTSFGSSSLVKESGQTNAETPRLRYLAWQEEDENRQIPKAWLPDGHSAEIKGTFNGSTRSQPHVWALSTKAEGKNRFSSFGFRDLTSTAGVITMSRCSTTMDGLFLSVNEPARAAAQKIPVKPKEIMDGSPTPCFQARTPSSPPE